MDRTDWWDCLFRGMERVLGGLIGLFMVSIGLWMYGSHIGQSSDLAWALLAMTGATWIGLVAVAGAAMVPVWMAVRASVGCKRTRGA